MKPTRVLKWVGVGCAMRNTGYVEMFLLFIYLILKAGIGHQTMFSLGILRVDWVYLCNTIQIKIELHYTKS